MIRKIIMFVILTTLLMACGGRPDVKKEITGREFSLRDTVTVDEDHVVAFTIRFEGDRLGGRALNNYNSSYTIEGDSIEIKPMATTLMAGPEVLMERETQYFKDLTDAVKINLEKGVLTLTTEGGKQLVFDEIK